MASRQRAGGAVRSPHQLRTPAGPGVDGRRLGGRLAPLVADQALVGEYEAINQLLRNQVLRAQTDRIVWTDRDGKKVVATNVIKRLDANTISWQSTERAVDGKTLPPTAVVRMKRRGG